MRDPVKPTPELRRKAEIHATTSSCCGFLGEVTLTDSAVIILFAASEAGGQNLAILYSFAATCKANGVNYRQWLEDILVRINTASAAQIDSLLPRNWKISH